MLRYNALTKEKDLLEKEIDYLEQLIKQYDTGYAYYDTVEEERNMTDLMHKDKTKPKSKVTTEQLRILAQGLGTISADVIREYYDNPPAQSTISTKLRNLEKAGYLKRVSIKPAEYVYIDKEDADE